jgi:hypothetical protein
MVRKNRQVHGERQGSAKLTVDQVKEIRRAYTAGEANQCELASMYSMSRSPIGQIVRHETWRWLDDDECTCADAHPDREASACAACQRAIVDRFADSIPFEED